MKTAELKELLRSSENEFVERKSSLPNAAELRKTLVAFANSVKDGREAVLFLGVEDNGNVKGIEGIDAAQKRIREIAEGDCYPPVRYFIETFRQDEKEVLAVVIPESKSRPHFTGPAFVRKGSESVKASEEVFKWLIASHNDKTATIMNHLNQTVSAHFITGHAVKLASQQTPGIWLTEDQLDYVIIGCDAHVLRLQEVKAGKTKSYSLAKVTISWDDEKQRIKLEIDKRP